MSAQPRIEILLEEVIKRKGSDLHLQVGLPPMLRVDGALVAVASADSLTEESIETLIFAILDEDQKADLIKKIKNLTLALHSVIWDDSELTHFMSVETWPLHLGLSQMNFFLLNSLDCLQL